MTGFRAPVRPDLIGVHAYGAPVVDVPVRLNVNENPFPPPPRMAAALAAEVAAIATGLNRYPDRDARGLRTDLADYLGHGLGADRVWAGNGSNEVMLHLFQAFGGPGRRALTFTPTYSMYPEYARDTFTGLVGRPRRPDFTVGSEQVTAAIAEHRPHLVVLASPNNPTGTALDLQVIASACTAMADLDLGLVVVDEAYAEFRRAGTPSALSLLADHPRLVVTRTMSKAWALAGARVGYLAGHPAVIEALQTVRLPYHLSAVTQAVARTALRFRDDLLSQVDLLRAERDAMVVWLRSRGLHVPDSDANFVLVGRFVQRDRVWQALLERGVLVRQTGPAGYLRISVGTPAENGAVRTALASILARATDTGEDGWAT